MTLRDLPRVDHVLDDPRLAELVGTLGRPRVRALVRVVLDEARDAVRRGDPAVTQGGAAARVLERARAAPRTTAVINATGVILHTNLGRAPLGAAAVDALARTSGRYVALELDLVTGERGGRAAYAEGALAALAGAEAALLVNNNAAAVLLALAAVAIGKAVIVSRGELVEIGGGFRIPEVLARSGARLVEVGTTNRTRVDDFARALDETPDAAAILRVHPGNFRQTGFVERPSLPDLVAVARGRSIAVIEDLGGGALVDLSAVGLAHDPLVRASVASGADLVTFSTDKILGGPQGGVLVGRAAAIARARRDPLARALRMGRLPLVALEATLAAYLAEEPGRVPAIALARASVDALRRRVEQWRSALGALAGAEHAVVSVDAVAGGGTYAGDTIPSVALAVEIADPVALAARLRRGATPVVARVADGALLLDARTVLPDEDDALVAALREALSNR